MRQDLSYDKESPAVGHSVSKEGRAAEIRDV